MYGADVFSRGMHGIRPTSAQVWAALPERVEWKVHLLPSTAVFAEHVHDAVRRVVALVQADWKLQAEAQDEVERILRAN